MVLSMRSASYVRGAHTVVPPVNLSLEGGGHEARLCGTEAEAQTLAMMACALARATSGTVLIGEYDPRVQPVHCKRIAAFVPHDPLPLRRWDFARYINYRAALWNIDALEARQHAASLMARLPGMHEAFAYPLVGALLGHPQLLVLDRPSVAFAQDILRIAEPCAIFSTHTDAESKSAFSPVLESAHA